MILDPAQFLIICKNDDDDGDAEEVKQQQKVKEKGNSRLIDLGGFSFKQILFAEGLVASCRVIIHAFVCNFHPIQIVPDSLS